MVRARALGLAFRGVPRHSVSLVWLLGLLLAGLPAFASPRLGRRTLAAPPPATAKGEVRVAFFDADQTLRRARSGAVTALGPTDVELLPGVAERIARLSRAGYLVAIVSNQGGVGRSITLADADAALGYTARLIGARGGRVHYYDFAEHDDADRKPGIGMAQRLERLLLREHGLRIDKAGSFMVGDAGYAAARDGRPADRRPDGTPGTAFSNSDRLFAQGFGIRFFEAPRFFSAPPLGGRD